MARATPRLIDRGDLLAALDRASARKVTIISAPAGSGKTSLLRAWADRPDRAHRHAVVQVRRDQHDAQDFWLALLNAVRHAYGATSGAEPPAATLDFDGRAMVDRVLAELADHRGRLILVIDDLHELNSPDALAQLTRLLTNLPPGVHAVLTTRRDLRLGLHELRLAGELAEIRAADLRFTERETRELLDASGIALSEAGAALLHQRTEGWAAGLRLAVISLTGHPDPERFVAEFSGTDRTVARVPARRDAGPPAQRRPAPAPAHLAAQPGQRRTGGPTDRPPRLGTDPAGTRGRERVCRVPGPRTDLVCAATTACSRISSGWSCAGRCPSKCRRCICRPPGGSPSMATWSRPSGTPRRRATGAARPGCWPTIRSA